MSRAGVQVPRIRTPKTKRNQTRAIGILDSYWPSTLPSSDMSKKKNQDRTNQNSSSATAAKPTTPSKSQAKKIRRKIRRQHARSIAAQALEEETFDMKPDDDEWLAVHWSSNGAHIHNEGRIPTPEAWFQSHQNSIEG
ncbi:hypothetical protein PSTG_10416 [Puccinia striiformis f. sp. tritici PST-78]|uniref:Uncharacterized protein n=1 Tax=Puccinia striiformis f. sp. tritici PST-78 TaxID=1165861 RepID=A0A0L0VAK4_9BASI|nr:hypothetical protein PSTG_10416 [Puccinia striiformis f. sp. tritici PST-78]